MIRALTLVVVLSSVLGATQGRLAKYDLSPPLSHDVNANIRINKVMGEIGTLMLGEFKAGWKSTPHHHTHEQINVGISGAFDIVTTAGPHRVAARRGLFVPPDVQHGNDVSGQAVNPLLLEFQPVRRLDFPPERQEVTFPSASSPAPPPGGLALDFTPESTSWVRLPSGARVSDRKGSRSAVAAWEIPAGLTQPTEIGRQLPGAEQFLYVIEGGVEIQAGGERHAASPGTVIVNPPDGRPMQIAQRESRPAMVLVFEAARAR